ncbi:hypothetical protein EDD37DRAFT_336003 [Exophiala viscosa]|uniref:uncharacterized protein n=1 Tax=Exophiala viscosa TaxID=2486360 RepID=UPI002192546E|nr:hypothetical protein EDD37DRAFT_336003 [Exophiala viscosa]
MLFAPFFEASLIAFAIQVCLCWLFGRPVFMFGRLTDWLRRAACLALTELRLGVQSTRRMLLNGISVRVLKSYT